MTEQIALETMDHEARIEDLKAEHELMRQREVRKRLESFWWAAVFIWAGAVFVADYLDILPQIREEGAWSWIFLGAGLFGLIGAFIRAASIPLPRPTGWDYFWSALFLIIGASGFLGGGIVFPLMLIVVGAAILADVLFRHN